MDNESANANTVRRVNYSPRGIPEQRASDACSLIGTVYGKACQHRDGNGIGHVAPEPSRRGSCSDRSRSEGIITGNSLFLTDNIGTGTTTSLAGTRAASQPFIKGAFPRAELLNQVMVGEGFGGR
jgi:hypothetical protein